MNTLNVNLNNLTTSEREMLTSLIEKSNKVEVKKSSKWYVPEVSQQYWCSYRDGEVFDDTYDGLSIDENILNYQQVFPTQELAEKESNRMKARTKIFKFLRENEGDWEGDWLGDLQRHSACYNHSDKQFHVDNRLTWQYSEKGFYSNRKTIALALRTHEIVEAYKIWFEVE